MLFREKGLKFKISMADGKMSMTYMYPISQKFKYVFEVAQEAYGFYLNEIPCKKNKDVVRIYCCWHIFDVDSTVAIPKFRKIQTDLMLLSRRAKLNLLEEEISSLNVSNQYYAKISNPESNSGETSDVLQQREVQVHSV